MKLWAPVGLLLAFSLSAQDIVDAETVYERARNTDRQILAALE